MAAAVSVGILILCHPMCSAPVGMGAVGNPIELKLKELWSCKLGTAVLHLIAENYILLESSTTKNEYVKQKTDHYTLDAF